ncbi:MAG: VirB3 family type IV secretion system protein [Rickettsiales bacterium]|nr:VirB3 family type IV secretion system protein [Rickettsiales bacterium]
MKLSVLKSLANPQKIFMVPYTLAMMNFVIQFFLFMIIFFGSIIIFRRDIGINPLSFLISLICVHLILASIAKREPHLATILIAKIRMFKIKIPNKLDV